MISSTDNDRIQRATAYDSSGEKVGKVDQLFLDDQTGEPSWVTVTTGLFGTSQTFVPVEGANLDGDDLRLAHGKGKIKDAPRIDVDQHLEPAQEQELYRYYGLQSSYADGRATSTSGTVGPSGTTTGLAGTHTGTSGTAGTTTGVSGDDAALTLSEERLDVGTESREVGQARLRKYTTSETETVSVPVTKEKLVVERSPVDGRATEGTIDEDDHVEEITLREERAVVGKETHDVEQVRIGKEQVTEQQQVTEQVRKEHAEVDLDGAANVAESRTDRSR